MIRVLNITTGGLRREGVSLTQIELVKHIDMSKIHMDYLAVHDNDQSLIEEFMYYGCNVFSTPDRLRNPIKYIFHLIKHLRNSQYDIIHVHGSSALIGIELLTAKILKIETRIAHSRNSTCNNILLDKTMRSLFYHTYTLALACSEEAGEWLFKDRKYYVVHNGKDLLSFRYSDVLRTQIRRNLNSSNSLCIGFVGRLNKQKNLIFLLDVFKEINKQIDDSVLFLIGDGPDRQELLEKAISLNIDDSVFFTGSLSNVPEMLQAMDIMCLPSLYEGLPNVVLEWQIAGLPSLVSSNVTSECKVTELVQFLPIDQGVHPWVDAIMNIDLERNDRMSLSNHSCDAMIKAGFEISESAKRIEQLYFNCVASVC